MPTNFVRLLRGEGVFVLLPDTLGSAAVIGDVSSEHTASKLKDGRVLILASFTESEQRIGRNELRLHGLGYAFEDLVTGESITSDEDLVLAPYRFVWLRPV